ncbi:hypothetical protein [Streptomyces sp. NPDC051183]|uniref:hypothetical protein n=1 Tax=Streptomyces sp. NPDC051183 TaxID=3155165 RepID=UPI003425A52F
MPLDATHTFDLAGPDGLHLTADQLATATVVNLQGGGFARVLTAEALLAAARPAAADRLAAARPAAADRLASTS